MFCSVATTVLPVATTATTPPQKMTPLPGHTLCSPVVCAEAHAVYTPKNITEWLR